MPLIAKEGDLTQGHCWPPAPLAAQNGSNVYVNGLKAIALGDQTLHPLGCTDPPTTHPVVALGGSPSVFIGNIAVVRDADPMGCGDVADTLAGTVYADGGGNIGVVLPGGAPGANVGEEVGYVVQAIRVDYNITLNGRYTLVRGTPPRRERFEYWRSSALTPQPSNGFVVDLKEEFTGRIVKSYQYEGAPNISPEANEIYLQALDPYVRFEMIKGPFTVDNAGSLTLIPSYLQGFDGGRIPRKVETGVRMIYGVGESIITYDAIFDVNIRLTTGV